MVFQKSKTIFASLMAFYIVLSNFAMAITDQVVNSVDVIPYLGLETARIKFQIPIKYISHQPVNSGSEIAIRILFVNLPQAEVETLPLEQLYRLPSKNRVSLESVIFENFGGKPSVVLRFKKPIKFNTPEIIKRNTMLISFPNLKVAQINKPRPEKIVSSKSSKASPTLVGKLMNLGQSALEEKRFGDAVKYFLKLHSMMDYPYNREALELLGVAREGNKQYAHARSLYREFIDLYPRGEDTTRIKKRLSNLGRIQFGEIAISKPKPMPKPKVKSPRTSSRKQASRKTKSNFSGSFSQFYYHSSNSTKTVDGGRRNEKSSLHSILSLRWKVQTSRYTISNVMNAGHLIDFSSGGLGSFRFNTFKSEIKDKRHGYFASIGRQYSRTAGVFGQFDGVWLGIEGDKVKFNSVAGYPVTLSERSTINSGKQFYGFNIELNKFVKNLYTAPYFVSHSVQGITDRMALGYELKYSTLRYEGFNLLDYDLLFNEVNIFSLRNKFKWKPGKYFTLDYKMRKYPSLAASNAIYYESTANTISELLDIRSEEEIIDLAREYSGVSNQSSLGVQYELSKKTHVHGDITYSTQKQRASSPIGVSIPDEDKHWQLFSTLNIMLQDVLLDRNALLVGLRQTYASFYRTTTVYVTDRLSLMKSMQINSQLRFERRSDPFGGTLFKTNPSIKLSYRYKRHVRLYSGLGLEWWSWGGESRNANYQKLLVDFGYRWMF